MAYIDGYDYDIFISYSHDDNFELEGKKGWVTAFYEILQPMLEYKRHLKGIKISIDFDLDGNTLFNKAIEDRISRSALFFVIHSNGHKRSEYCQKELNWFHQHHKHRPGGLESRLFNLLINNIKKDEWPIALSQDGGSTSGFVFHNAKNDEEYGDPIDPTMVNESFKLQMLKLVDATKKTLDNIQKENSTAPVRASASHSGKERSPLPKFKGDGDVEDILRSLTERVISEIGENNQFQRRSRHEDPTIGHEKRSKISIVQTIADLLLHSTNLAKQKSSYPEQIRYLISSRQKDISYAFELAGLLSQEKGIDVKVDRESDNSIWSMNDFKESAREADNLVLMFGEVYPGWVDQRIQKALGIIADQLKSGTSTLKNIWIAVLPGCPENSINNIPLLKVHHPYISQTLDTPPLHILYPLQDFDIKIDG